MSETAPETNSKGPAQVQYTPPTTDRASIPASEVKPEEIGTLSMEYRDGQPVIVVSGGKYIPAALRIVNSSGAAYAARFAWVDGHAVLHTPDPRPQTRPQTPDYGDVLSQTLDGFNDWLIRLDDPINRIDPTGH